MDCPSKSFDESRLMAINDETIVSLADFWEALKERENQVESVIIRNAGLHGSQNCRRLTQRCEWKNSKLRSLIIQDPKLGPRGTKILAEDLLCNVGSSLQILDFATCRMGHFGGEALTRFLPSQLTILNLERNNLGDDGVWKLAAKSLSSLVHLEELNVSVNSISDNGVSAIGKCLPFLKRLRILRLSGNQMKSLSVESLVIALANESSIIKLLDVSQNQIQPDGAKQMARIIRTSTSIELLDLSHNQVGDDGAVALSEAIEKTENSHLQKLTLSGNLIGDLGAGAFVDSLDSRKAALELNLDDNPDISPARIRILEMLLKHQRPEPMSPKEQTSLLAESTTETAADPQEEPMSELQQLREEVNTLRESMARMEEEMNDRIRFIESKHARERTDVLNLIEALRKELAQP